MHRGTDYRTPIKFGCFGRSLAFILHSALLRRDFPAFFYERSSCGGRLLGGGEILRAEMLKKRSTVSWGSLSLSQKRWCTRPVSSTSRCRRKSANSSKSRSVVGAAQGRSSGYKGSLLMSSFGI
jgi:hypothetical protein